MPQAVIEDWNQFKAFLSAQPLCRWSAEKHHQLAQGLTARPANGPATAQPRGNDNADLAAALSSMA